MNQGGFGIKCSTNVLVLQITRDIPVWGKRQRLNMLKIQVICRWGCEAGFELDVRGQCGGYHFGIDDMGA